MIAVRGSYTSEPRRLLAIHEAELHGLERQLGRTRGAKHARQEAQHRLLVERIIPRDKALATAEGSREE